MFGYATDETETLMPLTHNLATSLGAKLTEVRKNGVCPWVRPDGKTQVTCEYKVVDGRPIPKRVHTVVISTQVRVIPLLIDTVTRLLTRLPTASSTDR